MILHYKNDVIICYFAIYSAGIRNADGQNCVDEGTTTITLMRMLTSQNYNYIEIATIIYYNLRRN